MKLRYKGILNGLNHIIISDPSYDESVTCRYERTNLKNENWFVDIDIKSVIEQMENFTIKGTEFFLFLCKDKRLGELKENGTISYLKEINLEETEIGMDTACIALGTNDKAKEIIELRDDWQPECSLNTLTDGLFGVVKEGKIENDIVFIWLSGYLDEDTGYSIEDVIKYLQYQLNIEDLQKDISNPIVLKQEIVLEKMKNLSLKFKELTKEDLKLLEIFDKDNRFSNIEFAGTYLAGIEFRNKERENGNLDGKLEKSPYSKLQATLIKEYAKLQKELEITEKELDI